MIAAPASARPARCASCRGRSTTRAPARATMLGCQATIHGDAEILFDEVPIPSKRQGAVASIAPLSPEIVEVVVRLNSPFTYRPGQYVKTTFAGFPSRDYSPTAFLDGGFEERKLVLHIKRYDNG